MAKIDRYNGNVEAFGSASIGTERTLFGSSSQADDLDSNLNADYKRGWGIISPGVKPPRQFFNGALYTASQLNAYIHQMGIAEWNSNQEYHSGSICQKSFGIFQSITDSNTGNDPELDSSNWAIINTSLTGGRRININGGPNIWQTGETTFTSPASGDHLADMWIHSKGGSTTYQIDVNRSISIPGGTYGYAIESEATTSQISFTSNDVAALTTLIEGYDLRDIVGKKVFLSFWVYATTPGVYCVSFSNDTRDASYVAEYTVNASNTWEFKTVSLMLDYSFGTWVYINDTGLRISFCQACGPSLQTTPNTWVNLNRFATINQVNNLASIGNKFSLKNVQLESGSIATPFEYKNRASELGDCQRYLCPISISRGIIGNGWADSSTVAYIQVPISTDMRSETGSTIYESGPIVYRVVTDSGSNPVATISSVTTYGGIAQLEIASTGMTIEHPASLYRDTTSSDRVLIDSRMD